MEELDIAAVTKRSIHGVVALVTRSFFIQVISFAVNFILTILLSPAIFGVYFVVSAVIAFLQYFSDIGLAAALIQKKEQITQDDLKTTFTIQQLLVISAVIIALAVSPFVGKFYKLEPEGILLFQALVISFFLSSLKTIPSILLERDLRFEKLVIPQIVETLVFNLVVLFMALKGYGVASFTVAVLARGLSGLITIYIIKPWRIELGFSKSVAKRLLSFGIPFQANSFLALLKDDLMVAYVGKVLPLAQVGYIGFAQKWALMPLRLIMDNIIRITFPSFSRLQHEKKHLGIALEKSLFVLSFLIFPALIALVILFPYFIAIIPKYHKWEPALLSLGFFAVNAGLSSISTPLTNALNAIGKIKITLYLMVFWTIATWVLTPLGIIWFGFNGFALMSAVIAVSVVAVVYIAKKHIEFSIIKTVHSPLVASIIMGVILYFASKYVIHEIFGFIAMCIVGALIYFVSMWVIARNELQEDIATVRKQFVKS
ncbi:MAG TPA: oligosaccharide flippase family protein [Patescibacteria group bacterium]